MLHLYQSNLTETLFDGLTQVIQHRPAGTSLLTPECILVQNPDMAQWLKMELAEQKGIAANLNFPLPSSFLWQIFHALFEGQLPKESPYSKDRMSWHLMQLLPEFASREKFSWLQAELLQRDSRSQLRLFQLCGTLADTFDQYLMYRPDWISQWEQGEGIEHVAQEQQWQPILWQALAQRIVAHSGSEYHRGRLLQETIKRLNEASALELSALPKRISIFGISAMPEQMLLLLNGLAKHLEIHWFQLNPCQQFWLDIIDERTKAKLAASSQYIRLADLEEDRYFLVGNPLLASMGQLGREHLSLMQEQLEGDWLEEFHDYPTQGALHLLQQEILELHCRGQFESLSPEQLTSNQDKWSLSAEQLSNVSFHSGYSALREIEILKDELLRLFEQNTDLMPNDVLVMMPDVAAYAPFIQAVFDKRPGEPFLPVSINDLSARQESPFIDSFLQLLGLAESRFQVSEITALLEVPAVMRRFGISEEELITIKHWLEQTGVRWGLDSEHRKQFDVGDFDANSWHFGLKRMLTGYAMSSEAGLFDGSLPYDEIEGSSAVALGKLLMFIDSLELTRDELAQERTAEQWCDWVALLLNRFYLAELPELSLIQRIGDACQKIEVDCTAAAFEQPLAFPLLRELLSQALGQSLGSSRFRAGAINFCTLMPMRTIPFKVVCLLGMNDGIFPRTTVPASFDLMAPKRRRGDRSRRLDDRYLFLEALLSCRRHLHISWVGRDIRDDSELPPSILVNELRDYLAEAWLVEGDESLAPEQAARNLLNTMTTLHPLQAFDPDYFQSEHPKSYAKIWADSLNCHEAPRPFGTDPIEVEHSEWVELGQLEAMLTNPCQSFLQRQLGVYFDGLDEQDLDAEPFELNALQGWQLKREALSQSLAKQQAVDYFNQGRLSGQLPVAQAGELLLTKAQESISSLAVLAKALQTLYPLEPKEIRLQFSSLENMGLLGSVECGVKAAAINYWLKPGKLNAKDLMRAWLRHLLICASGMNDSPMWLIDSEAGQIIQPVGAAQAKQILQNYLTLYLEGLARPLPFFIRSAWKALELQDKELAPEQLLAELLKEWQAGFNDIPGEGDDPYIARCYPELAPCLEALVQLAQSLLTPLRENLESQLVRKRVSYSFKHEQLLEQLEALKSGGAL